MVRAIDNNEAKIRSTGDGGYSASMAIQERNQMSAPTIQALIRKILAAKQSVARLRQRTLSLQRQIEQWSREVNVLLTSETPNLPAPAGQPAGGKRAARRTTAAAKHVAVPARRRPKTTAQRPAAAKETVAGPAVAAPKAKAEPAREAQAKKPVRRMTIREAVLKILSEKSPATVKEIREGVQRLGATAKSLHVALCLLAKKKVIESAGRGSYRLPATPQASS